MPSNLINYMNSSMRFGAFAGVALFFLTIVELPIALIREAEELGFSSLAMDPPLIIGLSLVLEFLLMVAGAIMYIGFIKLSEKSGNRILKIISYFMVFQVFLFTIFNIIDTMSTEGLLSAGLLLFGLMFIEGISMIIFGAALLRERKEFRNIAIVAGAFNILTGLFDITIILYFLGALCFLPTLLVNSYLLYEAAKKY